MADDHNWCHGWSLTGLYCCCWKLFCWGKLVFMLIRNPPSPFALELLDGFFITNIFIAITLFFPFFFKNTLFKLFILLECKYDKLQFGVRISSIEVSKQKLHSLRHSMSTTTTTTKEIPRESIQEWLFSQERRNSVCFLLSISVYAAYLNRRASRCFLTELQTSTFFLSFFLSFIFSSHNFLSGSEVFITFK